MSEETSSPSSPAYGTQLTILAFIRAKPGQSEELGRRLHAIVEPSRREPGNINYDLHRSVDDPDVWVVYENWKSPEDLDAHFETPHLKDFVARLGEVLDGELEIRRLSMISKVDGK